MKRYWVIGGNYADTKFDRMQDGGRSRSTVRSRPMKRRRPNGNAARGAPSTMPARATGSRRTRAIPVLGGWRALADSKFDEPAAGGGEEWHGPFKTYEDAKIEWSRLAWSTVDDAMSRYRIEKLAYGERPRKAH